MEMTDGKNVKESAPSTDDPMDRISVREQHRDPFVLTGDVCARTGCDKPVKGRVPCLDCMGDVSYCSEKCLWDHYPDHHFHCIKKLCELTRSHTTLLEQRKRQLGPRRGFTALMGHIIKNVEQDKLLSSLFFVRLPYDTTQKMGHDYPVKRIDRRGCLTQLKDNAVLRDTWKAYIRHVRASIDLPPFLYFFAYPPDMSFVFMTAVPFEEQERFDEALQPQMELIPCPCIVHTPRE